MYFKHSNSPILQHVFKMTLGSCRFCSSLFGLGVPENGRSNGPCHAVYFDMDSPRKAFFSLLIYVYMNILIYIHTFRCCIYIYIYTETVYNIPSSENFGWCMTSKSHPVANPIQSQAPDVSAFHPVLATKKPGTNTQRSMESIQTNPSQPRKQRACTVGVGMFWYIPKRRRVSCQVWDSMWKGNFKRVLFSQLWCELKWSSETHAIVPCL